MPFGSLEDRNKAKAEHIRGVVFRLSLKIRELTFAPVVWCLHLLIADQKEDGIRHGWASP